MGGGLPVGAYGGRREIMEKGVYFAPFSTRNHLPVWNLKWKPIGNDRRYTHS